MPRCLSSIVYLSSRFFFSFADVRFYEREAEGKTLWNMNEVLSIVNTARLISVGYNGSAAPLMSHFRRHYSSGICSSWILAYRRYKSSMNRRHITACYARAAINRAINFWVVWSRFLPTKKCTIWRQSSSWSDCTPGRYITWWCGD